MSRMCSGISSSFSYSSTSLYTKGDPLLVIVAAGVKTGAETGAETDAESGALASTGFEVATAVFFPVPFGLMVSEDANLDDEVTDSLLRSLIATESQLIDGAF